MKGVFGVVDPEGQHLDPVAMQGNVACNRMIRIKRRGQDKADLVLFQHVGSPVADAGFRPLVSGEFETEGGLVIMCCLFGIADIKFDMIGAFDWKSILFHGFI